MTRNPQKKPGRAGDKTPDFCPTETTLPGLAAVLSHLQKLRSAGTTPLFLVEDEELDEHETPSVQTQEMRNPPRDLLDALLMLRLHSMLANAGLTSFRPPRGSLQVIVAPIESDRTDIRTILPRLIGRDPALPDPAIRVDDDVTRKRTVAGVLGSLRADILQGNPVIVAMAADNMIPDDLCVAMQPTLRLPPLSRHMLQAVMAFHFDQASIELRQSDARIAQLSDVALSSIFASEDLKTAIERLERAASQKTHTQVTLDDVHGQSRAVGALRQVVEDLRSYQSGAVNWAEVTKSFLLLGPPGTGKSMMAAGLAGSAGINFVKTSYSDCQKFGHQGDMLKALNAAVESAISGAPVVFFIDEIDSFHSRDRDTGSRNGYIIGVVNGLLTQLDRLASTPGVILIAATNDAKRVDAAVIRPGRFDRHIHVGRPDRSGIRSMLKALLGSAVSTNDLAALADQLLGASGAEIAALTRDAQTRARAAGTDLSIAHIQAAADDIHPRFETDVLWRIAVHEAGHLLAGHLLGLPDATSALVSARGACVVRPRPKFRLQTTMHKLLCLHLAGRGAEEAVFQTHCDGSGNGSNSDLAQATREAVEAECTHGFGSSPCWIDPSTPFVVLPPPIQERVEARLVAATDHVRGLFVHHRPDLERIARVLLERQELDAAEIAELLSSIPLAPGHTRTDTETDEMQHNEAHHVDPAFSKETLDAHPL
jgi:cell division protease FtsH